MPRLRPPDNVRNLSPSEYREARRQLVADEYRKQARAADAAAHYQLEQRLARSDESLIDIRDRAMRHMSPLDAVKFADRIAKLREEQESIR